MALSFIELELWAIKVLQCGNRDFRLFRSCDLDLDLMTFIYELDPYSLEIHRMCKCELPTSTHTDRQTDTTEIIYHAASRVVNHEHCSAITLNTKYTGWSKNGPYSRYYSIFSLSGRYRNYWYVIITSPLNHTYMYYHLLCARMCVCARACPLCLKL